MRCTMRAWCPLDDDGSNYVRVPINARLFPWDQLDDCPSLKTLREFLAVFPDAELLASLRRARGRGRNDYPVHVCWGCFLLTIALRHTTIQACLD